MSTKNKRQEKIDQIKTDFIFLIQNQKDFEGYPIAFENTCNWLDCPEIYKNYITDTKFREKFNARYLRNDQFQLEESKDTNDTGKDFIMLKNVKSKMNLPWFSVDGFKIFCMIMKTEKSFLVRKYFIQIEKDYWRVLNQDYETTKEELKNLNIQLEEKARQLEEMERRFRETQDELDSNRNLLNEKNIKINLLINKKNEMEEDVLNVKAIWNQTKVKELLEEDVEYTDYGIDKKYTNALELYNEKYLIPLYFVDYKTELKELLETKLMPKIKKLVNKKPAKKSKESDSEIEDLQENKETTKSKVKKQFDDNEVQNIIDFILDFINGGEDILQLSEDDMLKGLMEYYGLNDGEDNIYPGDTSMFEDESKNHVYCIKPTKTKAEKKTYMKIGDLFIANKVHLEELGKALKDHKCPPFGDNAFYAPYNKIVRDAKKVFVDKIYNEKLKEKNVQNAMQVRSSLNKY